MAAAPAWTVDDVKKILKQEPLNPGERYRIDVVLENDDVMARTALRLFGAATRILIWGGVEEDYPGFIFNDEEEVYPGAYYLGLELGKKSSLMFVSFDAMITQGRLGPDFVRFFINFVKFPSVFVSGDLHPVQKNNFLHFWAGFLCSINTDRQQFDENMRELESLVPSLYYPNAYSTDFQGDLQNPRGKFEAYGNAQIAAALHKTNGDVAKAAALLKA